MGRRSTGAWTTTESLRIELSFLLKHGYIQKDKTVNTTLNWTDEEETSVQFASYHCPGEKYLTLREAYAHDEDKKLTTLKVIYCIIFSFEHRPTY